MQKLSTQEQFINLLMQDDSANKLVVCWENREIDQIFQGLLPDRPGREATMVEEYLRGLSTLPRDRDTRLALFFLCLDEKKAFLAAESLNIDPDSRQKIMETIRLRQEFYFTDNIYKVKKFLALYGEPLFRFLQKISEWQVKLHDHAEIRNEARAEYFSIVKKSKDPIYIEDLEINRDKLIELGVEEGRVARTLDALLDFVHQYPHANREDILVQKTKNVNSSIGVKLIKKFLGKY